MKILFFRESEASNLNPSMVNIRPIAGTENSFICLANELSKRHDVKVYCPSECRKFYKDTLEYIPFVSYSDFYHGCIEFKPDIIVVVANPKILFDIDLSSFKIVFWQHNHPLELKHFNIEALMAKKIPVVLPSLEAADYSKKYYNNPSIFGIYNGIRDHFFEESEACTIQNKIVFLSAPYKQKGIYELISIAKQLPEYSFYVLANLDIYGYHHDENLINELKLDNIKLVGGANVYEIKNHLMSAELAIVNPLVGNKEVCCVAALESMCCGIPVIGGGDTVIDPILNRGGIASLDIVAHIKQLSKDGALKKKLGTQGKIWTKHLTWSNLSKIWENILFQGAKN